MGEIKFKHKFNVGEIVQFKGCTNRFIINNVMSETCSGGTQILYKGLPMLADQNRRWEPENKGKDFFVNLCDKPMMINETMLEKLEA